MRKTCPSCGKEKDMFSWETSCYSCKSKAHDAEISIQIKNGEIDCTHAEDDVFCPYCGEKYGIEDDWELHVDGENERECPECGKTFSISTHVSLSFSTERI